MRTLMALAVLPLLTGAEEPVAAARSALARGDAAAALALAAPAIDPRTAGVADLAFLVETAQRAGDGRLAVLAVGQAILRFPAETVFRDQEIALLLEAGRDDEARAALRSRLERSPGSVAHWRSLAAVEARRGDEAAARAALDAALLLTPEDAALRRVVALARLRAGQAAPALAVLAPLIGDGGDREALTLAARAADQAADRTTLRTVLARFSDGQRPPEIALIAARVAAEDGDPAAALAALDLALRQPTVDPAMLAWAASLAEKSGDDLRAESLHRAAIAASAAPTVEHLRLALLLHRRGRTGEARPLLEAYRAAHPGDPAAEQVASFFAQEDTRHNK